MLVVRLLGQFEVLRDDSRITISTRNAQSLFAFLILNAGKAHRRERLAGLLWPDSSEENARSNLRHELWRLRKALESGGESYILADDLTIAFNSHSEFSLDVRVMESIPLESSTADDLIDALSTYRGELLPGFYDEWVFMERDRLNVLFETRIARLLEILQAEGRWEEVIDWGTRWIAMGSWPEPAYRALMSASANTGDIAKAVATYERYAQAVHKELGIKPSEQTHALYKRLKGGWKTDAQLPVPTQVSKFTIDANSPTSILPKVRHSNLPKPLTNFIGREKEIQQVEHLVLNARLVTITGPGGVGKTRLAIQVAEALEPQCRDGVRWIELASLIEPVASQKRGLSHQQYSPIPDARSADLVGVDPVARTMAKALRIPESPGQSPLEGVVEYLHDKKLLLVLDNCEHLINACAALVERLLGDCPEVTILATSREALGVPGEKAWLLPSLSLPERELSLDFKDIFQSEAVCLFTERTADILLGYKLSEVEAPTIAQICLRLDGIPLAIELAAARMNLLSAQEIAARLDHRFSLLTGGRRTALPRHQTLRAAIEWSHDLLNEAERVLFRRLSVFAGSFTLEAAEAICANQEIRRDEVLTLLGKLVDKSLVNVEPTPQDSNLSTRYRFLDTIRSFGYIKLDEAGETRWMSDQRTSYYLHLVEAGEPELVGPKQLIWLTRLKEEHINLQAVLQWSLDTQDTEKALKLTGSLWRYWWIQGHHNEGREWLGKALSMPGSLAPPLRAKALNGAGILAREQGDFAQASAYLNECLDIQRSLEDKIGISNAQKSLGRLSYLQEDFTKATSYYEESLKYKKEIGDTRGIALLLHNLAFINEKKGEFAQAEELLNECLILLLEVNDRNSIAGTQLSLGYIMYELGNVVQSEDFFRKSIVTLRDLGGRFDIIECLEGFAGVATLLKQPQRAARLLAAAQALREIIDIPVARDHQARHQHIVESVANQLDAQEIELYTAEGKAMSLEEAVEYALSGIE